MQKIEQHMPEILLIEIVVRRVFKRSWPWSTQRPTMEEKHIEANVLTMPLEEVSFDM